jgi:hypothetical protein
MSLSGGNHSVRPARPEPPVPGGAVEGGRFPAQAAADLR